MQTVSIRPTSIRPEVIESIRMVGKIVTFQGEQFKIYSVEGVDFYAFASKVPGDDTITCDLAMTAGYREEVYAFLLPMDRPIGEGYGFEVHLSQVKPGVCLAKCVL